MVGPEQRVVDIESFVGLLRANNGYTAKTPLFLALFFFFFFLVKGILFPMKRIILFYFLDFFFEGGLNYEFSRRMHAVSNPYICH